MKRHFLAGIGLAIFMVGAVMSNTAQALVIDDFETGSFTGSSPISNVNLGPSTAGFGRILNGEADNTSGPGGAPFATGLKIDINLATPHFSNGAFSHSQKPGGYALSSIAYDIGGLNLNDEANAFRIQLKLIDEAGFLAFDVDGTTFSLSTNTIIIDNGFSNEGYADFLFSDFVGEDFTDVSTVRLIVDGSVTNAMDATIDNFMTVCSSLSSSGGSGNSGTGNLSTSCAPVAVPSGGTLPAMALGLAGLIGLRLRRQHC